MQHGSSPRVRGTDKKNPTDPAHMRFIPACAGNRSSFSGLCCATPVHPRVCGEQAGPDRNRIGYVGSSPRVRGTVADHRPVDRGGRFIPACAGNSRYERPPAPCIPVHPRVCGEQAQRGLRVDLVGGSSPRVRGTGHPGRPAARPGRFIPACAGNRDLPPGRQLRARVHPRVCGEQGSKLVRIEHPTGSSPRVRGTANRE